ncbi:MAG: alpha-hydroxy-acid oxidizing protein [Gammaproteobacteria bacterium]|nr:alpha-hydroxy-acid oxidizing protein [Gammaproteobacteria bacterium]
MRLSDCHNTADFRELARRRLPAPLFHYIDGGADDELSLARNVAAFDAVDLVPRVLAGIDEINLTTTVLGQKLGLPLFYSPTAMQRLFHHEGERAIASVASEFDTLFGLSTIGTRSIEEMGNYDAPKLFQLYVHEDPALTRDLVSRCRDAGFDALALTVDTVVAGNRERDYRTGFTTPLRLTPRSLLSFASHPRWSLNYLLRERFDLPNVSRYISAGSSVAASVMEYIDSQMKTAIDWDDAAAIIEQWGGPFAIKGLVSPDDARRAVDVGATAIMISNHGGRQLDGTVAPFDQVKAIRDEVGKDIEIIVDGGVRRGTDVIKALAAGADCCAGGRFYLYALAAAGAHGVRRATQLLRDELVRDMRLMGVGHISDLDASHLRWRHTHD